jgi:glycerate kinase
VRILVAPQEYKGTLTATEAAQALATGLRRADATVEVDLLPMSDGGPGFLDALDVALDARRIACTVRDPLLRTVEGAFLLAPGGLAVVEAAQANGLLRLAEAERDALRATTEGVGDLLLAAASAGAARAVVGVGGSATTDGGSGMARALGARFLDAAGRDLLPGGVELASLERIEWRAPASLAGLPIVVATDVTNPLTGPEGAAVVYGPQKGASADDVATLDLALRRFAGVIRRDLGIDVEHLLGAGAAGGLAAGLVAFLGAELRSGFDVVAEASRLEPRLRDADLVVTGEGRFDSQSLSGKTTGRLLGLASAAQRPCAVIAGSALIDHPQVLTLADVAGETAADRVARAAEAWLRGRLAAD